MANNACSDVLMDLEQTIAARRMAAPDSSYVARLVASGRKKMAQKVAEEASEVAIAAVSEGKDALVSESADLLFHLLVLWSEAGIRLEDVCLELKRREGTSGLAEKASRGAD